MGEAVTTVVGFGIAAAAKLAPSEVQIQLKAYGFLVDALPAAAKNNPEPALAGILAGETLVALPQTAAIVDATAQVLVAAAPFTGGASAAFAFGLPIGLEIAISTGFAAWTTDTIDALASELGSANTQAAILQGLAAYGQGELYNAQIELDSSAAMWSEAGQALASVGESLYSDLQSIGSWFPGLFSVDQNSNGTETLDVINKNSNNNWNNTLINITSNGNVAYGVINYTNGTSQADYYNPSSNESEQIWNYSGTNLSGVIEQVTYDYTNGTSQIALLGDLPANLANAGITSDIEAWSGPNGTGTLESWVFNYTNGQSSVNYPGSGSVTEQTFLFTGPNGTGTNTAIINYNNDGSSTWYILTPNQTLVSQGVTEVVAKYAGDSPTSPTQFAIFNYSSGMSHYQLYNPTSGVTELLANYTNTFASGTVMDTTFWYTGGGSQVTINGPAHGLSGISQVVENWSGQYGSGNNGQETSAQVDWSNGWKAFYTYQYGNGGTTPTQIIQTLQTPTGTTLPNTTFGPGPSYPYISGAGQYGYDGGGIAVLRITEINIGGYGLAIGTGSKSAGIDVIAQYDRSHGFTAAAMEAEAARKEANQLIAAAGTSPGSQPLSPFEAAKWTDKVITWSFASGPGTPTSPFSGSISSQYQAVIKQAVQTWAKASGLTFEQVSGSAASDIRIGWGNFGTAQSGVIGFTSGQIIGDQMQPGVIIRLENPAETALVSTAGSAFTYSGTDVGLYQAALHEIGHALGLADNADPHSIMFAELGAANTSLDLTDLANIKALYAPASSTPQVLVGPSSQGGHLMAVGAPTLSGPTPAPPLTYTPTLIASPPH